MDREIDLTQINKFSQKVKRSVIVDKPIIADEVMVDKVHQFSEEKYDQITQTLKGNPFLPNENTNEFEVISIDEYYFSYKNETFNLRGVIANNNLTRAEKKKIIKHVFKSWIKDYRKLERESTISIKEQLSLLEDVNYKRFSILLILLFIFIFVLNTLLFFSNHSLIESPFFIKASIRISNTLLENKLLEKLTVVVIALNFLIGIFGIYHNKVLREYRKQYLLSKQNVNELYANMKRAFMSKARRARRYYLRAYKKSNYKPYPIKKIDLEEYSIDNVLKYAQLATIHTAHFKRMSNRLNRGRMLLLWGGSGMMIGYYIYLIITIFL